MTKCLFLLFVEMNIVSYAPLIQYYYYNTVAFQEISKVKF